MQSHITSRISSSYPRAKKNAIGLLSLIQSEQSFGKTEIAVILKFRLIKT